MPKNKGRGGKNYRRGKNENVTKRELVFKEEGSEYAQVTKMLGNGRLEVYCFDNVRRIGHICGRLRKKVWINIDDIVLVSLRDFQDEKCDIITKYSPEEVRNLKQYGEIPDNIKINEKGGETQADVVFEDSQDEDDDDGDEDDDEEGGTERDHGVVHQTFTRPKGKRVMLDSSDDDDDDEEEEETPAEKDAENKADEDEPTSYDYKDFKKPNKKGDLNIDDI